MSLPVTWRHVKSFPVTWLPLPASYSPVGAQTYPNLPYWPSTATSTWLPIKWRHFRVTSSHAGSREVISCHVTATSCELQAYKSSNVPKTWLIGFLQPLPGVFRSNHVTSGSVPVTWGHVRSFPVTWLPPPASLSPVDQTSLKLCLWGFYSHFQVTSNHITSRVTSGHVDHVVISCHVTAIYCELQYCRNSKVPKTCLIGFLQSLPGNFWPNHITSGSLPVTWGHVRSFPVTWLPPPASYSAVGAQTYLKLGL